MVYLFVKVFGIWTEHLLSYHLRRMLIPSVNNKAYDNMLL